MLSKIIKASLLLLLATPSFASADTATLSQFIGEYSLEDKGVDYRECLQEYTGEHENGKAVNNIQIEQISIVSAEKQRQDYLTVKAHQPLLNSSVVNKSVHRMLRDQGRMVSRHMIGLNILGKGQVVTENNNWKETKIVSISDDGRSLYYDKFDQYKGEADRKYSRITKVGKKALIIESGYQVNNAELASIFPDVEKGKVYKKVCYFTQKEKTKDRIDRLFQEAQDDGILEYPINKND